ncbi:MAG: haloacid dehalogenase-like hydrolase [Candidatus Bathyarchaeia archaeon]
MEPKAKDKIVAFDVEGVIIPKIRFIFFEVIGRIGLWPFIKAAFLGLLYEIGLISLKKTLKNLYKLLKGYSFDRFINLFQRISLMPEVENTFAELKKAGFKTALISSGIPKVALENLGQKLGVGYISGLEIGLSEGCLTGDIWGDVIESEGKAVAFKKILDNERFSSPYCIGVADDRNNLPMFQMCHLKIGYNPDFILSYKSDYVVKGDLSEIIPIIEGNYKEKSHPVSTKTIIRETIHISGFLVPFLCLYLVSRYMMSLIIFLVATLYVISETERMFGIDVPIISDLTFVAAGKSEFQEFVTSPIFFAFGMMLSLLIFPEPIGYVSISVLTFGDGFASIFGSMFGKKCIPYNKGKKLEGTLFGFLFAFSASLLFVNPLKAFITSAVGMFVETLPLPVNDNVTVPVASGLTLMTLI